MIQYLLLIISQFVVHLQNQDVKGFNTHKKGGKLCRMNIHQIFCISTTLLLLCGKFAIWFILFQ